MNADFRLDEFLRVSKDITLPNSEIVTIRVLSDLELNARRDYALSESVRVAEQLKQSDTELYRTKIAPLADAGAQSLIDVLAEARRIEFAREAIDLYRFEFFPYPDNATDQEMIDTRLKQQAHEMEIRQQRTEHIVKGEAAYRDKMAELPFETLVKETQTRAIQVYSASTANDAELYYTIWCATETDGKKRWKTPEAVKNLPAKVINFLQGAYKEVDAVDPWALTKSESEGELDGVGENPASG